MTHAAAQLIVDKLEGAGINATADTRSATPPCVLVTPPDKDYDLACGATAHWRLFALAPNPANADTWIALDALVAAVLEVLPVERTRFASYVLANDAPALPAYRIEFDEGVDA